MKARLLTGLVAGIVLGMVIIAGAAYLYFAGGFAPVATSAAPMPFETTLARIALRAALHRQPPATAPIQPSETNLLAGAGVYQQQCAVCHGLPGEPETAIAKGMFPRPPQLFHGKGVTDDPPGETYWKASNGIRLTGMPGFKKSLSDEQLWQVSLLLANANALTEPVKNALKPNAAGK